MTFVVEVLTEDDLIDYVAGTADRAARERVRQGLEDDTRVAEALKRIRRSQNCMPSRKRRSA
jgi:anti-sigma factor RsiW